MLDRDDRSVGVDLGATGLRAVEVEWRDGRPALSRWAAMEFDTPVLDWAACNDRDLGRRIAAALRARGLRGHWAAHAVSGEAVVPQYFNFPQLMPEDVAEAVRLEVETALPFRADDALVSYILFPEQRGAANKVRTHGMAIAADGAFVNRRMQLLRQAGLEPFSVETESTACANAFLMTHERAPEGTTAVLNVGHRFSNLALLGAEGTLLVRDVAWAGEQMTLAIGEALGMDVTAAEQEKRKHWKGGPEAAPTLGDRLPEILHTAADRFVMRLRDTIDYWVAERLVPGLGQMFITGGGSQVHWFPEFLSEALGVPVQRWNPVQGNERAECSGWEHRLSVAYGLALRSFVPRTKS